MKKIKAKIFRSKEILFIIALLLLALPSILPLLHPGFFVTDDGEWMIIRLSAFYAALRDGQIPVRVLERLNFGYGYPVAEFLYPGAFYLGSLLHIIKFGFINAIKIIMLLSLVGSTFFTYKWLSQLFSRSTSLFGALVSLYVPYHLYDAYVRGSVGELFALLWVPFILWMIEKRNLFFTSLGIFFLILSHNTLALLFLPFIFIYASLRKISSIKSLFVIFFLGFALAAFFYIPIAFDLQHTVFSHTAVSNPLEYFASLELIGIITLLIIVLSSRFSEIKKDSHNKYKYLGYFFLAVTVLSVLFASSLTGFIWKFIPGNFIQFPFRLLSYIVVTLSFLTAYGLNGINNKFRYILFGILTVVLVISAYPYMSPKGYFQKEEGYYYTNDATTTVKDEYMPIWVKEKPLKRPEDKVEIVRGTGNIDDLVISGNKISFAIDLPQASLVRLHTIYWPGWEAFTDGKKSQIHYANSKGLIELPVPKGHHNVSFIFSEPPYRLMANGISIVAFIILVSLSIKKRNKF